MTLRWLVASLHLVGLAIGVGAIAVRARALQRLRDASGLDTVFRAAKWWDVAAIVWLSTGVWRAFGGLEKGAAYYLQHPLFHAKLGLFVVVVLLELWPAMTLARWRRAQRRSEPIDFAPATRLARLSYVELSLVLGIVFLATAITRGLGI